MTRHSVSHGFCAEPDWAGPRATGLLCMSVALHAIRDAYVPAYTHIHTHMWRSEAGWILTNLMVFLHMFIFFNGFSICGFLFIMVPLFPFDIPLFPALTFLATGGREKGKQWFLPLLIIWKATVFHWHGTVSGLDPEREGKWRAPLLISLYCGGIPSLCDCFAPLFFPSLSLPTFCFHPAQKMLFHQEGYCQSGLAGKQHFISSERAKHKPRVQIKWNQCHVCGVGGGGKSPIVWVYGASLTEK